MKTLYLECNMGAAGDMLMGALLELIPDRENFLEKLNQAGIPGARVTVEKGIKCGITGTHVRVTVDGQEEYSLDAEPEDYGHHHLHGSGHSHDEASLEEHSQHSHPHNEQLHSHEGQFDKEHLHSHEGHSHKGHLHPHEEHIHEEHFHPHEEHSHEEHLHSHEGHSHQGHHHHGHTSLEDISRIIDKLSVDDKVKEDVKTIYGMIAEAESQVHGHPVSQIHFHEVGTVDALTDITGCAMLMRQLEPEKIIVSPVTLGFGQVHCAHGILPVPAPATALLLRGIPCMAGNIRGELCTPTGAALVKYYANAFGRMPEMVIEKIGYGMGTKDFEAANCIRAILGES